MCQLVRRSVKEDAVCFPTVRELMCLFATAPGLVAARVCTLDEDFVATFPSDIHWIEALQDSVG